MPIDDPGQLDASNHRSLSNELRHQIEAVAQLVRESSSICVLTGAGISKESGIATFRDAQTGLWANYSVEELATEDAFRRNRKNVWQWYQWRRRQVVEAAPNPGHIALANLSSCAEDFTLITQNVDGLHQRAGSQDVIEYHGNLFRTHCLDHGHPIDCLDYALDEPPLCAECGAHGRPGVIWFGEMLDADIVQRSLNAANQCQLFLSIGTSSLVYPAADLAHNALAAGASIIEINPQSTPLSAHCAQVMRCSAAAALPAIYKHLAT